MYNRSASFSIISGLAACYIAYPSAVIAQSPAEVNIQAFGSTVRVNGNSSQGSGVIYSRQGSTYFVLTAKHVVEGEGTFEVVTADGRAYTVSNNEVERYIDIDAAILSFEGEADYPVVEIGDSNLLLQGNPVFVAGWAEETPSVLERAFIFTEGNLSARLQNPSRGYSLLYSNSVRNGMSGGPVFDTLGSLVGIHGQADFDETSGTLGVLGIPINTILNTSSSRITRSSSRPNVESSSQNVDNLVSTALEYIENEDYTGSIVVLNRATEQNPNSSRAYSTRAWARFGGLIYNSRFGQGAEFSAPRLVQSDINRALEIDQNDKAAQLLNFFYKNLQSLYSISLTLAGESRRTPEEKKLWSELKEISLSGNSSDLRYDASILHMRFSINLRFAIANALSNTFDYDADFHSQFMRDSEALLEDLTLIKNENGETLPFPLSLLSEFNSTEEGIQSISSKLKGIETCQALKPYIAELLINSNGMYGSSKENVGGLGSYVRGLQWLTGRFHPASNNSMFDWTEFDRIINSTPDNLIDGCSEFLLQ